MKATGTLISLMLGLAASLVAVAQGAGTDTKTWRGLDELTAEERQGMDLRTDTPRSAETSYLPAERFPFEPPYTAEELGYRLMNFPHIARWSHVMADAFGVITKTGYMTQNILVGMVNDISGTDNADGHIHAHPGAAYSEQLYYYTYPPKDDGVQQMWVMRRTDAENPTKLDFFVYTPSLRRVRRQPAPRRDAQFPDNVPSFDDFTGRDAWEYTWRFIGTDVLYETIRYPNTRPKVILANADGTFYEKSVGDFRIMGDDYPFYRPDGGVDCYVIVSETRKEWLPDYNVSKIVYWVDRHYSYPLRIESYDPAGNLKIIQTRFARRDNPQLPDGDGYTNNQTVYWDLQLDLISYSVHDAIAPQQWSDEEKEFFTPDFMRRRWLVHTRKSQALIDGPDQFHLRPHVYADRFPHERPIQLAPDVAARIEAQEAAGHLVFSADEEPPATAP